MPGPETHVNIVRSVALLALIVIPAADPALAQGSSGPSGLFGATRPDSGGRDLLTLQMAISEAFDSDVAPEFRARLPGGGLPGRRSNVIAGGAGYARNRRLVQLSAVTTGFLRYNYDLEQIKPGAASAQLAVALRMPGRLGNLTTSHGVSYSPSYLYQLLPGDDVDAEPDAEPPPPADPDYRVDTRESLAHRTRVRLQTGSGLGWRMVTSAQYARTDFRESVADGERQSWDASTRAAYQPTRRGSVSFGYRFRESSYRAGRRSQVHEFPLGFDLTPALTPTRRITFRVQISPTVIDGFGISAQRDSEPILVPNIRPERVITPAEIASDESGRGDIDARRYAVQGDVSLSYPFSYRWHLSAVYQRRIQTLAVLSEPVATDGARLRMAGVLGRRVDVALHARYTRGGSAFGSRNNRLTTAQADARLRFALTRSIALSGEYLYFRYDFAGRLLAPDLPGVLARHGLRVGISMFTQLGR
jgi:hypothetical protein